MAKFSGNIGFVSTVETSPGIWTNDVILRPYHGDFNRQIIRNDSGIDVNDGIKMNNEISIVCDKYIRENLHIMKFVEIDGIRWKISSITIQHPRLIITFGGLYNNG